MKKKIITFVLLLICFIVIIGFIFKNNKNNNNDLTTVKLAEVTHSVFYTPMYVAIENGYFKEVGIDIDLILTPGADKVSAAVLSNSVDVGFAGTESAIYIYQGGENDYLVTFAGLTKRDGQFILTKDCTKDFKLEDLYGKEILVGRKGGMPSINFLNAMYENNIDVNKININYSVEFAALSGAFIGGNGDFVNLFEPTATSVVNNSNACIVESIGKLSGEVPYTAFYTRKSKLDNNKELYKNFTKAIAKGLEFVKSHQSAEIAKIILPQFPDSSLNDLTTIINNYKQADTWLLTPFITEESYNHLQDMMIRFQLINEKAPYSTLINNYYEK